MQIDYHAQIWRETGHGIAHAQPHDVASTDAALAEAVNLFLNTAADLGSLKTVLTEAGYALEAGQWRTPDGVSSELASALVEV